MLKFLEQQQIRAYVCSAILLCPSDYPALYSVLASLVYVLLDGLLQCRLGDGPDDGVHLGAVLEEHDGGNAPDAVLCRHCWALVSVQLVLHMRQRSDAGWCETTEVG